MKANSSLIMSEEDQLVQIGPCLPFFLVQEEYEVTRMINRWDQAISHFMTYKKYEALIKYECYALCSQFQAARVLAVALLALLWRAILRVKGP